MSDIARLSMEVGDTDGVDTFGFDTTDFAILCISFACCCVVQERYGAGAISCLAQNVAQNGLSCERIAFAFP